MLNMGVTHIFDQSKIQKKIVLEKAIKRAAIECYALEGMYPPDITYLEAHYGIQIDHQHYAVYYDAFADNIMPEIQVHLIKKGV